MTQRLLVFVGTKKGAFILESDAARTKWSVDGPHHAGWPVYHMALDQRRSTPRLWAAVNHAIWGPYASYSDDLGRTWSEKADGLAFAPDSGKTVAAVWHIEPGHASRPDDVWCGVDPAALFRSTDGGETWAEVPGLNNRPSTADCEPGGGGLILHTIVPDAADACRIYAGISTGGIYRSDDVGATWTPKNRGVAATFRPDPWPEHGQCVHKMVPSPVNPDWLFQQNHCGVYRSRNAGESWERMKKVSRIRRRPRSTAPAHSASRWSRIHGTRRPST
jgi:hypothetical protein